MSPFKEFGFFAGLFYSVDRGLQRLSPNLRLFVYELLAQPIPDVPLLPPRLSKGLEMREIRAGDPEVARMPARPDIKESRFEQNAICLGAFQKGQFIGHIWFCFHAYEEDEVRCTFVLPEGNQAVFDFDLYVFPEYRMGLGFAGIWNGANEFLRRRGVKLSYSRLTRFNLASRRAHRQLGARRVGRMLVLQVWHVEFMIATVSPYVHLSLQAGNRVRVKLRPEDGLLDQQRRRLVSSLAG
ncbi:MAG: GNAT family N-acetyltransferase [Candidatus Korobacteraceae bacterium]